MPASSTSATAWLACSRWRATTTRATSSPIRARRPASAASCATCSPWARGRSPASTRCRSARPSIPRRGISSPAWSPASAATAIPSACRRSAARCASTRAMTATAWSTPWRSASPQGRDFLRRGLRRRHADRLSRLQDRPRRHPRRHHGLGRVRRGLRREAPDRAGRRSVLREAAARSLPRDHGQGLRHRHPGHGRGRADLLGGRDGRQGRSRRHARSRQGAVPRRGHERLRDDAVGEPGAHAHGAQAGERRKRPKRSSANGGSTSRWSARPRRASASSSSTTAEIMADLPIKELGDQAPVYKRPFACAAEAGADRCRLGQAADEHGRRAGETARPRPTSAPSAGSGSNTTTSFWATPCSARAATPRWCASKTGRRASRSPPT